MQQGIVVKTNLSPVNHLTYNIANLLVAIRCEHLHQLPHPDSPFSQLPLHLCSDILRLPALPKAHVTHATVMLVHLAKVAHQLAASAFRPVI